MNPKGRWRRSKTANRLVASVVALCLTSAVVSAQSNSYQPLGGFQAVVTKSVHPRSDNTKYLVVSDEENDPKVDLVSAPPPGQITLGSATEYVGSSSSTEASQQTFEEVFELSREGYCFVFPLLGKDEKAPETSQEVVEYLSEHLIQQDSLIVVRSGTEAVSFYRAISNAKNEWEVAALIAYTVLC